MPVPKRVDSLPHWLKLARAHLPLIPSTDNPDGWYIDVQMATVDKIAVHFKRHCTNSDGDVDECFLTIDRKTGFWG
jgi:hypothetical protein